MTGVGDPQPGELERAKDGPAQTAPDRPIRVLLVDDQSLVRTGFRMILQDETDISVVGEAADGQAAIAQAAALAPDVIVMDIRMPVLDGVEATRRIVRDGPRPRPRVLVLTTFDADEDVVRALRAGASGFLLKDVTPTDFIAALRIVAAGEALLAPGVTRRLLERFADRLPTGDEARTAALAELTARELEVLRLIARGRSNREIAEALMLAEPTVKTHVSHLLDKLGLRDRAQAVVLAYEAGLVRAGEIGGPEAGRDRP